MLGFAADPLIAPTGSERGSAFGYPMPMNQRTHSLAPRANPNSPIDGHVSGQTSRRTSAATAIVLIALMLAGCGAGGSAETSAMNPSPESKTITAPTSGSPSPAVSGRSVEFAVMAHGVDSDQSFRTTGANAQLRYGNGRLTGNTTIDGAPADAELLAQVNYDQGSGPFTGFWTFTFGDGSDLVLAYSGTATKTGDDTSIVGDLTVFGGTGSYASVTGGGTLRGERTVALGGDVDYRFSLTLAGLPTDRPAADEK
ncbi:unannotated protein [freshwater metagenome]|uniref:Unannotated protein n=1 Tax=freshwater metagenome TaxID=449393 RepID=A0A6J5YH04_9ZZZZ